MRVSQLLSLLLVLGLLAHTSAVLLAGALAGGAALAGGLGIGGGLAGLIGLKLVALKAGLIGGYIGSRKFGHKRHYAPSYDYGYDSGYGGKYGGGHSYGHGGYSYGHGGYSYGHGGHSSYHRRRRDTAVEQPAAAEQLPLEQYFQMVAAADVSGCGLKLVCELEAADPSLLADDERLILALFKDAAVPPSQENLASSAQAQYAMAAFLGRTGRATACQALYQRRCQFSRDQLMQALRSVDPQ